MRARGVHTKIFSSHTRAAVYLFNNCQNRHLPSRCLFWENTSAPYLLHQHLLQITRNCWGACSKTRLHLEKCRKSLLRAVFPHAGRRSTEQDLTKLWKRLCVGWRKWELSGRGNPIPSLWMLSTNLRNEMRENEGRSASLRKSQITCPSFAVSED